MSCGTTYSDFSSLLPCHFWLWNIRVLKYQTGCGKSEQKKYFPNMKLLFSENQYETENVKSMSIEENCLKKAYI